MNVFRRCHTNFSSQYRRLEDKQIFFCDQYRCFWSLAQLLSITPSSMWPRAMTLCNYVIASTTKGGLKENHFFPHNSPWTTTRPFLKTTVLIIAYSWNFKMYAPFNLAMERDHWSCDLRWGFLINDLALVLWIDRSNLPSSNQWLISSSRIDLQEFQFSNHISL